MCSTGQARLFEGEWKEFFGQRINLEGIQKSCLNGKLRGSRVRSIIWRILLKCLPLERDEWCTILSRTRSSYNKMKSQLMINPRDQTSGLDPNINNPLSLGDENPWQQYFADCELRECINRDVERTFPELQYFKSEKVRCMMSDVLFIYAKQHPDLAYRQGMHEILAPLIFVLNYDHQAFAHLMEQNGLENFPPEEVEILCVVNDQNFLEHDSFDIFTQLMMMLERWYVAADERDTEYSGDVENVGKLIDAVPFTDVEDADPMSEVVIKLRSIMNDVLAVVDPPLHRHLLKLQILPQFYGIRWLRLLFGREFPIHDLLFVWDAIFAFKLPLSLVDYVFVAMLEQIRHLMIDEDYSTTLQYLMRYPPVADVHSLIQFALHIKSPKKFERPQTPNLSNFEAITVAGIVHPNRGRDNDSKSAVKSFIQTVSNKQQVSSPKKILPERDLSGPSLRSKGGKKHTVITSSEEIVQLLQEQVSCLQSRLNNMDVMIDVVRQKIGNVIGEQLPKIIGNDDLKLSITDELRSIHSQIKNATEPVPLNCPWTTLSNTFSKMDGSGHGVIATDVNKANTEVHPAPPAVKQLQHIYLGSSSIQRQRDSRIETEMLEIRPHSLAR